MWNFIKQLFIWWDGQTLGTRFFTWRKGEKVGEDEHGNVYYRNADDTKRWVIFSGYAEGSDVPPGWHGWMHHRVDTPPSDEHYTPHDWQKPHEENRTGTIEAWRPPSSLLSPDPKPAAKPDYEAWQPE